MFQTCHSNEVGTSRTNQWADPWKIWHSSQGHWVVSVYVFSVSREGWKIWVMLIFASALTAIKPISHIQPSTSHKFCYFLPIKVTRRTAQSSAWTIWHIRPLKAPNVFSGVFSEPCIKKWGLPETEREKRRSRGYRHGRSGWGLGHLFQIHRISPFRLPDV